jgi:hypothetical protein
MSPSPSSTSATPSPTLVDASYPDQAPNVDESYQTIADFEWRLNRYTPPAWTVTDIELEDNDHCGAKCSVLKATLEHEQGDAIYCQPFDPWNHHAGPNIYRRHRIRLTSSLHDHSQIVTLTDDAPDYDSVPDTAPDTAPLAGIHNHLSETARLAVKSTDSYVAEAMPDHGKGSNVDTIDDAVSTIIAATRRVSITYQ